MKSGNAFTRNLKLQWPHFLEENVKNECFHNFMKNHFQWGKIRENGEKNIPWKLFFAMPQNLALNGFNCNENLHGL